jgi:hypothetical protein
MRVLVRLLVRIKGRMWVIAAAFRIWRRLPKALRTRLAKRAARRWPEVLLALLPHSGGKRKSRSRP